MKLQSNALFCCFHAGAWGRGGDQSERFAFVCSILLKIKVGQNNIIKYEGKNLSNKTITVTADFFALPDIILPYLIKTECFCFKEQTLKPGESQIFSMVFFLDPSLDQDSDLDNLKELTLTYKFSEFLR